MCFVLPYQQNSRDTLYCRANSSRAHQEVISLNSIRRPSINVEHHPGHSDSETSPLTSLPSHHNILHDNNNDSDSGMEYDAVNSNDSDHELNRYTKQVPRSSS